MFNKSDALYDAVMKKDLPRLTTIIGDGESTPEILCLQITNHDDVERMMLILRSQPEKFDDFCTMTVNQGATKCLAHLVKDDKMRTEQLDKLTRLKPRRNKEEVLSILKESLNPANRASPQKTSS